MLGQWFEGERRRSQCCLLRRREMGQLLLVRRLLSTWAGVQPNWLHPQSALKAGGRAADEQQLDYLELGPAPAQAHFSQMMWER